MAFSFPPYSAVPSPLGCPLIPIHPPNGLGHPKPREGGSAPFGTPGRGLAHALCAPTLRKVGGVERPLDGQLSDCEKARPGQAAAIEPRGAMSYNGGNGSQAPFDNLAPL